MTTSCGCSSRRHLDRFGALAGDAADAVAEPGQRSSRSRATMPSSSTSRIETGSAASDCEPGALSSDGLVTVGRSQTSSMLRVDQTALPPGLDAGLTRERLRRFDLRPLRMTGEDRPGAPGATAASPLERLPPGRSCTRIRAPGRLRHDPGQDSGPASTGSAVGRRSPKYLILAADSLAAAGQREPEPLSLTLTRQSADLRLDRLRHHHGVRRTLQESHPARQDPHAERLVPGAADAAGVRRLRRQHRLQPEAAGRRRLSDGDGRARFRALCRSGCSDSRRADGLRQA